MTDLGNSRAEQPIVGSSRVPVETDHDATGRSDPLAADARA